MSSLYNIRTKATMLGLVYLEGDDWLVTYHSGIAVFYNYLGEAYNLGRVNKVKNLDNMFIEAYNSGMKNYSLIPIIHGDRPIIQYFNPNLVEHYSNLVAAYSDEVVFIVNSYNKKIVIKDNTKEVRVYEMGIDDIVRYNLANDIDLKSGIDKDIRAYLIQVGDERWLLDNHFVSLEIDHNLRYLGESNDG